MSDTRSPIERVRSIEFVLNEDRLVLLKQMILPKENQFVQLEPVSKAGYLAKESK